MESAIIEFALHGYHRTSVDAIVKRAQVSKGTVFYHFDNKPNLFLACLDACLDQYEKALEENGLWEEKELFSRLLLQTKIKVAFVLKHEAMSKFFMVASTVDLSDETKAIKDRITAYREKIVRRMLDDVDHSYIRAGIDPEDALSFAWGAVETYSYKLLSMYENEDAMLAEADKIIADFERYVELIKYGIYK